MNGKMSLVTGATGHIGFALVKELEACGENFKILIRKDSSQFDGIDCEHCYGDVTDLESLEKAFEGVDVVYHLAGVIEINKGNEDMVWKVNVDGTKNVVEACKKCGVKRLIYASSVDAYPPLPDNQVMRELDRFDPDAVEGTYAKTKATATNYVLDNNSDTLETIAVYPGACCGPYDFKVSSIGEMVRLFIKGKFPISMSFGKYNFVDVRDVAKGMMAAAEKGRPGEGYILTDEAITVDEFICILSDICGFKAPGIKIPLWLGKVAAPLAEVYYALTKQTPMYTRYALKKLLSNCNFSIEKARTELGYNPMGAKQSLSDMVDWIKEYEKK